MHFSFSWLVTIILASLPSASSYSAATPHSVEVLAGKISGQVLQTARRLDPLLMDEEQLARLAEFENDHERWSSNLPIISRLANIAIQFQRESRRKSERHQILNQTLVFLTQSPEDMPRDLRAFVRLIALEFPFIKIKIEGGGYEPVPGEQVIELLENPSVGANPTVFHRLLALLEKILGLEGSLKFHFGNIRRLGFDVVASQLLTSGFWWFLVSGAEIYSKVNASLQSGDVFGAYESTVPYLLPFLNLSAFTTIAIVQMHQLRAWKWQGKNIRQGRLVSNYLSYTLLMASLNLFTSVLAVGPLVGPANFFALGNLQYLAIRSLYKLGTDIPTSELSDYLIGKIARSRGEKQAIYQWILKGYLYSYYSILFPLMINANTLLNTSGSDAVFQKVPLLYFVMLKASAFWDIAGRAGLLYLAGRLTWMGFTATSLQGTIGCNLKKFKNCMDRTFR